MGNAIRSEFRKFFTTRLWWGMAIGVFLAGAALAAFFALLGPGMTADGGGGSQTLPGLDDPAMISNVYTGGLSVSYLLTLAIGVMTIGAEYRHQTISATFLAEPRRVRVMGAKVVSLLGIGAFYGVVSLVGSVGVGGTIVALKGYSPFPDATIWRTLALSLLVLGLWALIGLGAGILIPNQVAALLVAIGVAWIVEPILTVIFAAQSNWLSSAASYMPSAATASVLSGVSGGNTLSLLAWWGVRWSSPGTPRSWRESAPP